MRLQELLTEALNINTVLMKLNLAIGEINTLYTQKNENLQSQIQTYNNGEIPDRTDSVKFGTWFNDNYASSKGKPGHSVHSQLMFLSKNGPLQGVAKSVLQSVTQVMQIENKTSASQQLNILSRGLINLGEAIPGTQLSKHPDAAKIVKGTERLKASRELMNDLSNQLKDIKASQNRNPKDNADKIKDKETKSLSGQQNDQAHTVVNQVLATLPKDVASQIRQAIAKSDNKLQALQIEMKKHNLIESKQHFEELIQSQFKLRI